MFNYNNIYLNTNMIAEMYFLSSCISLKESIKNEIKRISMKMYGRLPFVFLGICTKVSGSSIVPNRLKRWDPTSRCNGPSRSLEGSTSPEDVVSRCRTRDTYREIHCDEYLRLRLRKSKAIRFNRRERRYETRAVLPYIDFLGRVSYPRAAFSLRNMLIIRAPVTFLYYNRAAIRYLAPERRKTEIYYFPAVTTCYLCPAV